MQYTILHGYTHHIRHLTLLPYALIIATLPAQAGVLTGNNSDLTMMPAAARNFLKSKFRKHDCGGVALVVALAITGTGPYPWQTPPGKHPLCAAEALAMMVFFGGSDRKMTLYHLTRLSHFLRIILLLAAILLTAAPVLALFQPQNATTLACAFSAEGAAQPSAEETSREMLMTERLAPVDMRLGVAGAVALITLPLAVALVRAAQALGPATQGRLLDSGAGRLFRSAAIWSLASMVTLALGNVVLDTLLTQVLTGNAGPILIKIGASFDGMMRITAALAFFWLAGLMGLAAPSPRGE